MTPDTRHGDGGARDRAQRLGSEGFRRDFGVDYAYVTGSMYRGIASKELVVAMARRGFLAFLGAAGLSAEQTRRDIEFIRAALAPGQPFGVNLLCNLQDPPQELASAELLLALGVGIIEASAFVKVTQALVLFHLRGLRQVEGRVQRTTRILAKISRPEVARAFMRPAPEELVRRLLEERKVTPEQAALAKGIPLCVDLCVEADSGGHTDRGVATALLPAIQSLRQEMKSEHGYADDLRIGLAGGIGTPQAVAAAFVMGADFVLTGSINQCTVEAGISDGVKDRLQAINIQDTDYCPAGDMFEIGALVQVLKKGVLFPARANRLHALYNAHESWEDIPAATRAQIQDKYFKKSVEAVWQETQEYLERIGSIEELERARRSSKRRMAMIFRWYYGYSSRLSFSEPERDPANLQVHTGPALGAFNQWVKGTPMEDWRGRHVDAIALRLMHEAAAILEAHASALR